MRNVHIIDKGWNKLLKETKRAASLEVAVGILEGAQNDGAQNDGVSVAEYATYNEFGTEKIPSRPFMATSFDENAASISNDFTVQYSKILRGAQTARGALTAIGLKHVGSIKSVITGRNFLPKLADATIARKKGSTKTLIDSSVMVNSVQISVRNRS
jgi:HK97 gp10 family phage protein